MSFYFIKAGLQTSIQDSGRQGFMHLGISHSGAMDRNSQKLANQLVDKSPDSAVFEIAFFGPTIRFETAMTIAICGAIFDLKLNNQPVSNDETILAKKNDLLEFKQVQKGARAYLAFSGELTIEETLESYSTHLTANLGGVDNRQIADGDCLSTKNNTLLPYKKISHQLAINYSGNYLLRCVVSVESVLFSRQQIDQFFCQRFQVTPALNRMGIRLQSNPIRLASPLEIVSSGLTTGSVQITPSGQAIISAVDGQTIGGYPRIANVITTDLPLLGQLTTNDQLQFTLVNQTFAEKSLLQQEQLLMPCKVTSTQLESS